MKSDTVSKMKKAISINDDDLLDSTIEETYTKDKVEVAKEKTLDFLGKSYDAVQEDRKIKKTVGEFIELSVQAELAKLRSGQTCDLTISQAAGLFQMLGADTTAATDSLLQILKPVPNTVNPWTERRQEDDDREQAFKGISSQEMQGLAQFSDFLKILAAQGANIKQDNE